MNRANLESLLADVAAGKQTPEEALDRLRHFPAEDLGFAVLDHHRGLRQGQPEVVFCEGKSVEQVTTICERLHAANGGFLGTRASEAQARSVTARLPLTAWDATSHTLWHPRTPAAEARGAPVLVVSAGTSDVPVAEEAFVTATAFGARAERMHDVGVAGLHRLLSRHDQLDRAGAIIVVAGMEGALPSVVGGLVDVPVIAVPTSVGYGASFKGVAALLGMLNSCAAGVTVVNIDNGFGAGVAAARITTRAGA